MRKVDVPLSFNPTTRQVDCSNIANFTPHTVVTIVDTSGPGRPVIYDMVTPGLGYSSVVGSVLTLEYDTTGLSSGDNLVIFWDDGMSLNDALSAIALAVSPSTVASSLAALPTATRKALMVALLATVPDQRNGDAEPSTGNLYVNSSGYVVKV